MHYRGVLLHGFSRICLDWPQRSSIRTVVVFNQFLIVNIELLTDRFVQEASLLCADQVELFSLLEDLTWLC